MNKRYNKSIVNDTGDTIIVIGMYGGQSDEPYFGEASTTAAANMRADEFTQEWGWAVDWYYVDDEELVIAFQDHQAVANYETWYLPGCNWHNKPDDLTPDNSSNTKARAAREKAAAYVQTLGLPVIIDVDRDVNERSISIGGVRIEADMIAGDRLLVGSTMVDVTPNPQKMTVHNVAEVLRALVSEMSASYDQVRADLDGYERYYNPGKY